MARLPSVLARSVCSEVPLAQFSAARCDLMCTVPLPAESGVSARSTSVEFGRAAVTALISKVLARPGDVGYWGNTAFSVNLS